jgi:hypothetical protein
MGEGAGGGGQDKDCLVPPPLHPLPPKGGEILGNISKMLEINSQAQLRRDSMTEIRNSQKTILQTLRGESVGSFDRWILEIIWNL